MSGCNCATFTITSNTYTILLTKPIWGGEDRSLAKGIVLFDFWNNTFDTDDKGINSEPLRLEGIEEVCGDNEGLCFPFCFPFCFSKPLANKFSYIHTAMNNHEEVKITGLGNCVNAYYIIRNFHYSTMRGFPSAYKWSLELEFVKGV